MKKSVVTLLAVAALGAVVPTATVFANNNVAIKAVDPKVEAKIAQLGKEASRLQALRNLALERQVQASQAVINFEVARDAAKEQYNMAVAAYEKAVADAKAAITSLTDQYNNELAAVQSGSVVAHGDTHSSNSANVTDSHVKALIANLESTYNQNLKAAESVLEAAVANTGAKDAAKAALDTEENNVAQAKKALEDATSELNAAQAAYEKALADVHALDASAAATIKAGEKTADSAKPAEMKKESAKPASKTVAAATTKTAAKALPKTSAVK